MPTICPYCDEPLEGLVINGLHAQCAEAVAREFEKLDAQTRDQASLRDRCLDSTQRN